MKDIKGQIGYIRGLMDGLKLDKDDTTVKIMDLIVNALDDLTEEVTLLREEHDELNEYVETIDEDLGDIELRLDSDDEDDDFDDDDFGDDDDDDVPDEDEDEDDDE